MKIKITFQYDPIWQGNPFFAKAVIDGRVFVEAGTSWDEAREGLIKQLQERQTVVTPEPETIEI